MSNHQVEQTLHRLFLSVRISVDSAFGFIGHVEFAIGEAASAEQFIFGEITEGRLDRAVIIHFEKFLSSSSRFIYPTAPADTLGRHAYLHQHWWLSPDFFASPPLHELLARRGITVDSAYVADRHVRVVDPVGKHELIVFYLEGASTFSTPVGRIPPSMVGNVPPATASEVAGRARRAFQVVE